MSMDTIGEYGTLAFQLGLNPSLGTGSHLADLSFFSLLNWENNIIYDYLLTTTKATIRKNFVMILG